MKDYAKVFVPLINQLRAKGCDFYWGKDKKCSSNKLKLAIATTAPILSVVDPHKPFVIETDSSVMAVGAVLLQDGHLIAYESKKLNET